MKRDEFLSALWTSLVPFGVAGIHEGTVLPEEEILDSEVPPTDRDWVGDASQLDVYLYFTHVQGAQKAQAFLHDVYPDLSVGSVTEEKAQDWDAQWKASFRGVTIEPHWEVRPPWNLPKAGDLKEGVTLLVLNPGSGFGTGTHETTHLCLKAMGALRTYFVETRVLDFGSGSGVLSLGAALVGASEVLGVEIDPLANDNARDNAGLNTNVETTVNFLTNLPESKKPFDWVVANILKPVLLEHAPSLVNRVQKNRGGIVLSGLLERDVEEILRTYEPLLRKTVLGEAFCLIMPRGEWRAILWIWGIEWKKLDFGSDVSVHTL